MEICTRKSPKHAKYMDENAKIMANMHVQNIQNVHFV